MRFSAILDDFYAFLMFSVVCGFFMNALSFLFQAFEPVRGAFSRLHTCYVSTKLIIAFYSIKK